MLRSVTLGLALSVLVAACALVEQPLPPGTIQLHMRVRNADGPVELAVTTHDGVHAGTVQPASLPGSEITDVTFSVPPGDWWIAIDGAPLIPGRNFEEAIRKGCTLGFMLFPDNGYSFGCFADLPPS